MLNAVSKQLPEINWGARQFADQEINMRANFPLLH